MKVALLSVASNGTHSRTNSFAKTQPASPHYGWILHPVIDLLFCCGGLVWLLAILHFFGFGPDGISKPVQVLLSISGLGALAFSETHVMATLSRVYENKKSIKKFAAGSLIAAIACLILGLLGVFYPALLPVYLKLYLLLVAQHFTAQTYGLALLYCAKRSYFLSSFERNVLASLLQSTMWVAILRQLCYREWSGDTLLGIEIPFWGALPEYFCQLAEFAVLLSALTLLVVIFKKLFAESKMMPLPAVLMIITGVSIFLIGKEFSQTLWLYVPAFFHGSQYIAVSLAVHLKAKGLPEGVSFSRIATVLSDAPSIKYLGTLFLAALLFFQILPLLAGLMGLSSTVFAASSFAAIHFHHFICDRSIWKLRDPESRKLLLA
ncbi:MAG: hypothetical protein K2X27_24155 [Candidatus Obscuribacterales bacterium]|nr:hypothetical protein [Candidatus Obscuribacterales bacterium]